MTMKNLALVPAVPAVTRCVSNADSEARRLDEKARRKTSQLERFRDVDLVEDDFRKIFCLARAAGDTTSVLDALEIIEELCRNRLGLASKAKENRAHG